MSPAILVGTTEFWFPEPECSRCTHKPDHEPGRLWNACPACDECQAAAREEEGR